MEKSKTVDAPVDLPVVSPDFASQVGGHVVTMSHDMASHPPLPELTGTTDKQCQAFALTSDVQCQVKESTIEVQCQATCCVTENITSLKNVPCQGLKYRKSNTVCSASQCRLPFPGTQQADAQSQTEVKEPVVSTSSSDVCSQTDLVANSDETKPQTGGNCAVRPSSSHVHSQTDMTSNCRDSSSPQTDSTAVQAVCSSLDAMNQTDVTARPDGGQRTTEDAATMTTGRAGGHSLPARPSHRVQGSNSRDFQCQTWPESREMESQVDTQDMR